MNKIKWVRDVISDEFQFISDSQDVEVIQDFLNTHRYDSFYVKTKDGEYEEIYGMYGIIPYKDKEVIKLL